MDEVLRSVRRLRRYHEDDEFSCTVIRIMPPKKKIAYVNQCFPRLTETFVYREVEALRACGFDIVTVANRSPRGEPLSGEAAGFLEETIYVFPLRWFALVWAHLVALFWRPREYLGTLLLVTTRRGTDLRGRIRSFAHFVGGVYLAIRVRATGVQHLHAHFAANAATLALVMSRLLRIPFSFTVHNNIFTDRVLLEEKVAGARFVAVISNYSREWLLDRLPASAGLASKSHIVRCGVTVEASKSAERRPERSVPFVFCLAQLAPRKGIDTLVEACRVLVEREVSMECVIGGAGPQEELLRRRIEGGGVADSVTLKGRVLQEELPALLAKASLFVLPCRVADDGDVDGIPVVLMEAMARGVPVISTTVSGIPELVTSGESGLLVPPEDPVALANAMQRVLTDSSLSHRLGGGGREKVSREFDIALNAGKLAALFDESLGEPGL